MLSREFLTENIDHIEKIADEIDANRAINAIVEDLKVASISDLKIISKVVKDIIYK